MGAEPIDRHEAGVLQPASTWKPRIPIDRHRGRAHCAAGGAVGDIIILSRSDPDASLRRLDLGIAVSGQALASRSVDEKGCELLLGAAFS
jgi:hypothetical protein